MFESSDNTLFSAILRRPHHVLHPLLPPLKATKASPKRKKQRHITPEQHASFLQHLQISVTFDVTQPETDLQTEVDTFYNTALQLFNRFYPERTTTHSSRDPHYITPPIKAKLRRKNRLMRAGRTEEASAVAQRVAKEIVLRNKHRLSRINKKSCCRDMWAAVRQLTGRRPNAPVVDGVMQKH